jgi:hypothetical protein
MTFEVSVGSMFWHAYSDANSSRGVLKTGVESGIVPKVVSFRACNDICYQEHGTSCHLNNGADRI